MERADKPDGHPRYREVETLGAAAEMAGRDQLNRRQARAEIAHGAFIQNSVSTSVMQFRE